MILQVTDDKVKELVKTFPEIENYLQTLFPEAFYSVEISVRSGQYFIKRELFSRIISKPFIQDKDPTKMYQVCADVLFSYIPTGFVYMLAHTVGNRCYSIINMHTGYNVVENTLGREPSSFKRIYNDSYIKIPCTFLQEQKLLPVIPCKELP